jgi:hypothetical protein
MACQFAADVGAIVGPVLAKLGFIPDGVDDDPDEDGVLRHVAYFWSRDCKLQIYDSSREGEINCMIAPLSASDSFGLNADDWHFISRFSKRADISPQERVRIAMTEA